MARSGAHDDEFQESCKFNNSNIIYIIFFYFVCTGILHNRSTVSSVLRSRVSKSLLVNSCNLELGKTIGQGNE